MNSSGGGIARGAYAGSGPKARSGPAALAITLSGPAAPVDRHAVNNFAQKVQCLPGMPVDAKVHVSFGRRYARIYKDWGGQRLCWGWVDMTNGDIRRGGWKAPDMRVPPRGRITDDGIIKKMQWTGPPYL